MLRGRGGYFGRGVGVFGNNGLLDVGIGFWWALGIYELASSRKFTFVDG